MCLRFQSSKGSPVALRRCHFRWSIPNSPRLPMQVCTLVLSLRFSFRSTCALEDMSEHIPVLPLNSGSIDFTFSVDAFAVLLVLAWVERRRHRFAGAIP
jgi:hypothetical protein